MTPRSRTGWEKWPNFHRGAFRPPSGGGSLRRRPPAPSASRRYEPVKLLAAPCELERCECARKRSASSEGARGSRLFFRELECLSTVRERLLARVTWEKRKGAHVRGVCMKTKTRRSLRENCAKLISASGGE
ncbi:hypothetical protein QQF64_027966 [Cirrhinus molitorella]|uniref:Uncharacterized protein n=1 Tax=Cirrhinus molitorella TaxID=172907 RepID=A0ABR3NE77_9TELE